MDLPFQRAETSVVQALPIFGRSSAFVRSQSSAIRSPRAKGQNGSGASSPPASARRPAQPPRQGQSRHAAGTRRAWTNSALSTTAAPRRAKSASVRRLAGQYVQGSTLPSGALIEVETTDPLSAIDIPHFCNENGHELVSQDRLESGHRFVIRKKL